MRRRLIAVALLALATLVGAVPAAANVVHPKVVSANPVDFTPHILDGTVWSVAVIGDTVVVGGSFSRVADKSRKNTYTRRNVFAYGLRDGAIRPFAPVVNGPVYAVAAGENGTVYIGGAFRTVGGAAQRGLGQLQLSTGQRVASFTARINWGDVRAMALRGGRLYVGGAFSAINGTPRVALARISPTTGALDTAFDAKLSAPGLSRARVEYFDISPDGRRMMAIGALQKAAGQDRTQIVQLDVSGPRAIVTGWYTDSYKAVCGRGFETYVRQVKFSPNGEYFVVVSTGGASARDKLCDSAARFETAGTGRHSPTWVNLTGGDSLYSVEITGAAVYVGGHQRYLNNENGNHKPGANARPGPGAVSRPGIGAIHPTSGRALAWNPTRSRGVGVHAFLATPTGLIVGSDTDRLGGEYHGRIGMFPLS